MCTSTNFTGYLSSFTKIMYQVTLSTKVTDEKKSPSIFLSLLEFKFETK